jgi:hypothetical protein
MSNKLFNDVAKFVFLNVRDSTNKIYILGGIKSVGRAVVRFRPEYCIFSPFLRSRVHVKMGGSVSTKGGK